MIRLLQWLVFGHVHKWRETNRFRLSGANWEGKRAEIGTRVLCVCETCGKPKKFDLS